MADPGAQDRYGLNVGRWIRDHPEHTLVADGAGYSAQRRNGRNGRGTGPKVSALTLDELHAKTQQADVR